MSGNGSQFIDVTGEVLEANLRDKQFQLWTDAQTHIDVDFSESQESDVTAALKDHKLLRVRVRGRAEISAQGSPVRITEVEEIRLERAREIPYDESARHIADVLRDMAQTVPQEEWDKLPRDLTDNLDHYLYGTPKK